MHVWLGVVSIAAVLLAACGTDEDLSSPGQSLGPKWSSTTTTAACVGQECHASFEELRKANLRYADRIDFSGDVDAAEATAAEVRAAVEPLATKEPSATADDVRTALAKWGRDIQVSDNAVKTAGVAFAVAVEGGCVFGSLWNGVVEVNVGGYINDGGCLASYGH